MFLAYLNSGSEAVGYSECTWLSSVSPRKHRTITAMLTLEVLQIFTHVSSHNNRRRRFDPGGSWNVNK
jgi:hypothetical protein